MLRSGNLRRLLEIRVLQEEQCAARLAQHVHDLHRAEQILQTIEIRVRLQRKLALYCEHDPIHRQAALVEEHSARLRRLAILTRIANTRRQIEQLRVEIHRKRSERRKVETLIEEATARSVTHENRRTQQEFDDQHSRRSATLNSSDAL